MSQYDNVKAKLLSLTDLMAQRKQWKDEGSKLVFTNGCFDILHKGHIKLLNEAADQGDMLVIGLNTDLSVSRLKGPNRPVNKQDDRAIVLGALSCVDRLVYFDQDTPLELISEILPDVLVKGADYSKSEVVGGKEVEASGGRIHLVDLVEGYSSSNYIDHAP